MPNGQELTQALDKIRADLDSLNYEIEAEIEDELEGQSLRGFHCVKDRVMFQIVTVEDEDVPFFEVRYVLNAKQTIAREIKRRSLGKDEEDELELDLEEDEEYITQAKNKLVGLTSSEFQDLNKGLIERLASTETYYELYTIDEFGMEAFQVEKKIFPLEDSYNISKLESAIRAVLNKGKLGGVFLAHFYELEDFLDNKFEGSDEEDESELGYIG